MNPVVNIIISIALLAAAAGALALTLLREGLSVFGIVMLVVQILFSCLLIYNIY